MFKENKSKFLQVKCDKCNNVQNIFNKASTDVECLVCNKPLAKSTGGKIKLLVKEAKEL